MVQITGKYVHEKDENLDQYFKAAGFSEENIKKISQPGATVDVEAFEEENKYFFNTNYGGNTSFVLNVEFEEPMFKGVKSVVKREGNTFTVTSKMPDGRIGIRASEFTQHGFTSVLTFNGVTGKRYFKRV